jgi:acyl-CoA dehydrogenase
MSAAITDGIPQSLASTGSLLEGPTMTGLPSTVNMFDLRMSDAVQPLYNEVKRFIAEEVEPNTYEFFRLGEGRKDRWGYADGQLELLDSMKAKAKAQGLWNFFLPNAATGEGLSNLDYAYIAIELGKNPIASECLNCAAPDTGNMEVLERVGTPEQKRRWLEPLLAGEIRSAYAMTEPDVASSDANNVACRAVREGNEWIIDGEKYYTSGAGDPRCKVMIVMVQTSADAPPRRRQSQLLVPMESRSSVRCMCLARTMRRMGTCTSGSRASGCPTATSFWARDVGSRYRRSVWDPGASITACARSAPPRKPWS